MKYGNINVFLLFQINNMYTFSDNKKNQLSVAQVLFIC